MILENWVYNIYHIMEMIQLFNVISVENILRREGRKNTAKSVLKRLPKSKKINGKERIGIGRKIEKRYDRWYD